MGLIPLGRIGGSQRPGLMLVVIALGGDTSLRSTDVAEAVQEISREHRVVLTLRNDPQKHLLARRRSPYQAALSNTPGVAARNLERELRQAMPDRNIAIQMTDMIVRLVPLGPSCSDTSADSVARLGWMVVQDWKGPHRCVPFPEPQRIIQFETIEAQIGAGAVLICPFGAAITTTESTGYGPRLGEVQIDGDMAAALLAERVGADLLMLLGDSEVECAHVEWPRGAALPLGASSNEALKRISLGTALMGPKTEAACRFIESTGKRAAIGALTQASEILRSDRGLQLTGKLTGAEVGRWPTVLVVDDNEVGVRLCRRVLEKQGYRVLTASDGLEAVWLGLSDSPDMIMLDCAMPGMTTLEAMRLIRKTKPDVPILITTVDPSPRNHERFIRAGAAQVMTAPFKLTDLITSAAKLTVHRGVQKPAWWDDFQIGNLPDAEGD